MKQEDRRYIIGAELRASADNGLVIFARAVRYGALSLPGVPIAGGRETIAAGAFSASIKNGDDVVALYNHNQSAPLGRVSNAKLKLQDTPDALNFTVTLNPQIAAHRDLYQLVKDQTVKDCSFGFFCLDDAWSHEQDENGKPYILRTVRAARLTDVSLVTSPAYSEGATMAQARSLAYAAAQPVRIPTLRRSTTRVRFPKDMCLEDLRDFKQMSELRAKAARLGTVIEADERVVRRERCAELTKRIHEAAKGAL